VVSVSQKVARRDVVGVDRRVHEITEAPPRNGTEIRKVLLCRRVAEVIEDSFEIGPMNSLVP
jgi:hypothetical protein